MVFVLDKAFFGVCFEACWLLVVWDVFHSRLSEVLLQLFQRLSSAQLLCEKKCFTSSDPHHDMLGGGYQVRVVIKNMMGRMENLKTLISSFLGLVILVRWALVTMFLS